MSDNERYAKALAYATLMHEGQYRIGGDKYITHPVAVAEIVKKQGYGIDYQIAALFHDLLEDTKATVPDMLDNGANAEIIEAVRVLTKHKGYVMHEYVNGIKRNEMAFVIKNADRIHNLSTAGCTSDEFKRHYIKETKQWYIDFSDELKEALHRLSQKVNG
ncbi:MAG: bifunctional (p)ppGpp synthetase/guanosine-3',5'-bis(diphosphate) 3'-pyrophosphohydrolase [Ruminococcaceae bacterium]|nr:bifunctional (p)ppGpp synthetase/guanosine-3',5'-bis(diphosphate) 3'-pyrophosphohydrolase [Oscillospiraceae bacterium]